MQGTGLGCKRWRPQTDDAAGIEILIGSGLEDQGALVRCTQRVKAHGWNWYGFGQAGCDKGLINGSSLGKFASSAAATSDRSPVTSNRRSRFV